MEANRQLKAEIIAVGTELLVGQIVNTNARYLSEGLNAIGVDVYYHTVVGDNPDRMRSVFTAAADRSDLVVVTGGLGPTQDDITKEILAEFTARKLLMHEPTLRTISEYFASRGLVMSDNNARQAMMLSDADVLPNDNGMAVGVALTHNGTHWVLLPGPPREMKTMFERYAAAWIRARLPEAKPLHSVTLKFSGIGESLLEKELSDLIEGQSDPTIAPYAKDGEVAIRISTKAASEQEAETKLAPVLATIRERTRGYLYAERDIPLEQAVVELLQRVGQTVSVAESCTGGLLGELITSVSGSSAVFEGGVISYSAKAKMERLGVRPETIQEHGTISAETAEQMAAGCRLAFGTDWALAVTGSAGPAASEGQPPGTVYIAVAGEAAVRSFPLKLAGDREIIRLRAAKAVLYRLWQMLVQSG
jgi:nicotinamide-nucleotide amidase